MQKLKKWKQLIPFCMLALILSVPSISQASMKGLTLNMSESKKTITVKCPAATVNGGALIGGDGIDYIICYESSSTAIKPISYSGWCVSNTNFKERKLVSPTGWSENISLTEKHHTYKKNKKGVGWGRINY